MMSRFLNLMLLVFCAQFCFGQETDSLKDLFEISEGDSNLSIAYNTQTSELVMKFKRTNQKNTIERKYPNTDLIHKQLIVMSRTRNPIACQFINDTTWFIFGMRIEYAYYPFIYKTTDAGISWEVVRQSWPSSNEFPLETTAFHMTSESDGIWITNLHQERIQYRTTSDGGKTWTDKEANICLQNEFDLTEFQVLKKASIGHTQFTIWASERTMNRKNEDKYVYVFDCR